MIDCLRFKVRFFRNDNQGKVSIKDLIFILMNSFFNQDFISSNEQLHLSFLKEKEIELWVKREDQIHPFVSGNKFRKLKYNVGKAKEEGKLKLLTFGGAFSNHILATAAAAQMEGLKSIGVIRGEELGINLSHTLQTNPTLRRALELEMEFLFVSRAQYREKTSRQFMDQLLETFGDFYLIPEGGSNEFAVKGCEEILNKEDIQFDYICSCVGTGGTIAGLIRSSHSSQKVLGFPALKGDFLKNEINKWVDGKKNWELVKGYDFGGYAKYNSELIHFINEFKKETKLAIDPIYTGKMFFGILDMIKNNEFNKGSKILLIHTGGLQGIEGFNEILKRKNNNLQIV